MGQKVLPKVMRLNIVENWDAKWFAEGKKYTEQISEDVAIRKFLKKKLYKAGIAEILIERYSSKTKVNIYAARPGVIIGRKGLNKEKTEGDLRKYLKKKDVVLYINDVKNPEIVAQLVAERVATQIEKRVAFRRAMKGAMESAMKRGAKGIKICCSGRLGGAEMARREWYLEGRVPLHTLRAKIDYGFVEANTKVGKIGVKVWIFMEEKLPKGEEEIAEILEKGDEI